MARIPQIFAQSDIRSGPVAPEISPLALSGGAGGLADLGQGMANLGGTLGELDAKKKSDDAKRWHSEAAAQYTEQAITFLNDPTNASREDYADISFKFLKDKKSEFLQNAPPAARQLFNQFADNFANSHRAGILERTHRVKLENSKLSVEANVNTALGVFRQMPDVETAETLRQIEHDKVASIFGGVSPTAERKLREYIDDQFVIGVAEKNPDYARQILEKSEYIDEVRRKTLLAHIDSVEQRGLSLAKYEFEKVLSRSIESGFSNNLPIPPVDKKNFLGLYGKDDGELAFRKFEDQRQEANTAISVITGLKDKNAAAITKQANDFQKAGNVSRTLKNLVAQKAEELVRQQAKDPAGYLAANNDEVHSAFTAFQSAPDEHKARAFQKYADVALKFQGYGQDDRYLNLPTGARHVLPEPMAKEWAAKLNQGGFQEKIQTLEQFGKLFESYSAWQTAYNDLVTMPEKGQGLKPEYQLALQFLNWKDGQAYFSQPELVASYFGAVDNAELLKEIGQKREIYKDYSEKLDSNVEWQNWARNMYGEFWQRADEVAAAKRGLIAWAWTRGKGPSESVREAVETFITKHQWTGSVNGSPLPLSRKRKDGSMRSDDEMEDIQRRLAVSLKYLDVDQLDKSRLQFLPSQLGENSKEARLHTMRYLLSEGFFVPEPDGNAVTLYVMSDNGTRTQLTDKNAQPFRIHLDNLPRFEFSETQYTPSTVTPDLPLASGLPATNTVTKRMSKGGADDPPAWPAWQDDEQTHWPLREWTVNHSEWGKFKQIFLRDISQRAPGAPDWQQMLRDLSR